MKKHFFVFLLIFVFSTFLFASEPPDDLNKNVKKNELKYNLAKGVKFTFSTVSNTDGSQEAGGQEQTFTTKGEHEYSFEVLSVDDSGNMNLEMEYKKRYTETPTPEGPKADEHPDFIGKKVKFVLSPEGELSGFTGFEELPGGMDKNGEVNEKKFESYIRGIINLFPKTPGKPVDIGETWNYEYKRKKVTGENKVIDVAINYTYKLVEETNIEVTYKRSEKGEEARYGMVGNVEMEGEGTQTIMFDQDKGMFLSLKGTSTEEGTVEIPSMSMVISVANENTYSRTVKFN
ncbi:DUF6263 family protein [candidate division KSB1 bacterium]